MAQSRIVSMLLLFGSLLVGQTVSAIAADNRLQVLNFSMERCDPCQAMQPVLAKLIMEGWQIRQIDIARDPQLAAQYKLKSAPTLIMLAGGRELDRVVGTLTYNKLLTKLEAASRAAQSVSQPSASQPFASQPIAGQANAVAQPSSLAQLNQPAALTQPQPAITQLTPSQLSALQLSGSSTNAPQLLAQRGTNPVGSPAFEPSMVRGQSPGPADVPDLDVDSERMLEFVKDLPEAPKSAAPTISTQPTNIQLASSSSSSGRVAVQPPGNVATASAQSQVDPMARAQQATVRIRIEDANSIAFGTGTVIYVQNDQALVLTCGHMFRDLSQGAQMSIDVFDKSGQVTNVPAQVVSHSTDQGDIGLMEFRCPYPITPVPISKRAPALGDTAFSFGCDRGADPTRRDTQIKRINRYLGPANVEIHGAPVVGRSGGGLFNAQGQIIGVCNAADAEDDEGIYAGLPVIDQHVSALRLESLPGDDASVPNPVQLASATAPARQAPAATLAQAATQVRCVIRDAHGKETALLIDRPSEELVAMLKQSAVIR